MLTVCLKPVLLKQRTGFFVDKQFSIIFSL